MAKVKQLTAWVGSAPGQIARIAAELANRGVNITALTAYEIENEGPVRLQVSDVATARQVLHDLGVRYTEEEVLRLTVNNRPGILAEIARRLADADINVQYTYLTVAKGGKKADLVMGVSDVAGASSALEGI